MELPSPCFTNHGLSPRFTNHGLSPCFTNHGLSPCFTNHGLSPRFPSPVQSSPCFTTCRNTCVFSSHFTDEMTVAQ